LINQPLLIDEEMIPDQALKSGIEIFTHRIYTQGKMLQQKVFDLLAICISPAPPYCLISFVHFFA
jgi:hypothetical protein